MLYRPLTSITEVPMPRPRSYHGRPASISVEYTHSRLSRWGFTPVVLEYLRTLRLPERLAAVTIRSAKNAHFRPQIGRAHV